jgi:DNA-binding transcriptional regulator YiaG
VNTDSFYLVGETSAAAPLHYTQCGLEGIYLQNGFSKEDIDGEVYTSVTDVEGLHWAIGRHLVSTRKTLSKHEIRFLRQTMGLSQKELAEDMGNDSQSIARWEKGQCDMPGSSDRLLRFLFLLRVMTDEEIMELRDFMTSTLPHLNELDEFKVRSAQFSMYDCWKEEPVAA